MVNFVVLGVKAYLVKVRVTTAAERGWIFVFICDVATRNGFDHREQVGTILFFFSSWGSHICVCGHTDEVMDYLSADRGKPVRTLFPSGAVIVQFNSLQSTNRNKSKRLKFYKKHLCVMCHSLRRAGLAKWGLYPWQQERASAANGSRLGALGIQVLGLWLCDTHRIDEVSCQRGHIWLSFT